eukprot:TRINITY_DN2444_c0_g1_i1.p1 TRINITY_DN2444_c0_g1~~TRINITY_DN2444_c0_g1_i1.p1  ORF type:complete len:837 (+),score=224.81 TRINITY_DN2444_c0_g1_i1:27-2537(+)
MSKKSKGTKKIKSKANIPSEEFDNIDYEGDYEDMELLKMEKEMGWKSGSIATEFYEDGLDGLLDILPEYRNEANSILDIENMEIDSNDEEMIELRNNYLKYLGKASVENKHVEVESEDDESEVDLGDNDSLKREPTLFDEDSDEEVVVHVFKGDGNVKIEISVDSKDETESSDSDRDSDSESEYDSSSDSSSDSDSGSESESSDESENGSGDDSDTNQNSNEEDSSDEGESSDEDDEEDEASEVGENDQNIGSNDENDDEINDSDNENYMGSDFRISQEPQLGDLPPLNNILEEEEAKRTLSTITKFFNQLTRQSLTEMTTNMASLYATKSNLIVDEGISIAYCGIASQPTRVVENLMAVASAMVVALQRRNVSLQLIHTVVLRCTRKLVNLAYKCILTKDYQDLEQIGAHYLLGLSYLFFFNTISSKFIFELFFFLFNPWLSSIYELEMEKSPNLVDLDEEYVCSVFQLLLPCLRRIGQYYRKNDFANTKNLLLLIELTDKTSKSIRYNVLKEEILAILNSLIGKKNFQSNKKLNSLMSLNESSLTIDLIQFLSTFPKQPLINFEIRKLLDPTITPSKLSLTKVITEDAPIQFVEEDPKLRKIYKKLRITSNVKKSIVKCIFESKNPEHCYILINKLQLTKYQQQDIIIMLLHCCLKSSTKNYSSFYPLAIQEFLINGTSKSKKKMNLTLRLIVKDKFKTGDFNPNLSLALGDLISNQIIPLNFFENFPITHAIHLYVNSGYQSTTISEVLFVQLLFTKIFSKDSNTVKAIFMDLWKTNHYEFQRDLVDLVREFFISPVIVLGQKSFFKQINVTEEQWNIIDGNVKLIRKEFKKP